MRKNNIKSPGATVGNLEGNIIKQGINKSNTKKIIWCKNDYNLIEEIYLNRKGSLTETISPISDEEANMAYERLINS